MKLKEFLRSVTGGTLSGYPQTLKLKIMEVITREIESKGFAMAEENGTRAGMMTYSKAGAHLIIIDHTEVDPAYNGKGVGKQMLYKIVEMARAKNMKIIPLCPFAANMFTKLDDIKDVLN